MGGEAGFATNWQKPGILKRGRNGNGEPWHSMPRQRRNDLLDAVYGLLGRETKGVVLFGIALDKRDHSTVQPIQRTCEEMAGHFDAFLTSLEVESSNNEKQRGLM